MSLPYGAPATPEITGYSTLQTLSLLVFLEALLLVRASGLNVAMIEEEGWTQPSFRLMLSLACS